MFSTPWRARTKPVSEMTICLLSATATTGTYGCADHPSTSSGAHCAMVRRKATQRGERECTLVFCCRRMIWRNNDTPTPPHLQKRVCARQFRTPRSRSRPDERSREEQVGSDTHPNSTTRAGEDRGDIILAAPFDGSRLNLCWNLEPQFGRRHGPAARRDSMGMCHPPRLDSAHAHLHGPRAASPQRERARPLRRSWGACAGQRTLAMLPPSTRRRRRH